MKAGNFLFVLAAGLLLGGAVAAADAPLPGSGFDASRYATLWMKSPFVVASTDAPAASPDYDLVGIAQIDGVSYASLIDKNNNNQHFLISGDHPAEGVSLVSITRGQNAGDTTAVIQKNGQSLTLKLTAALAASGPAPGVAAVPLQGLQIPMPGSAQSPGAPGQEEEVFPGGAPGNWALPPGVHFHRPMIRIPPRIHSATAPPPPSQ